MYPAVHLSCHPGPPPSTYCSQTIKPSGTLSTDPVDLILNAPTPLPLDPMPD
jgi:hypothetical protein